MTVDTFVAAARRFVEFVEESESLSREAFVLEIQPRLLDVYASGMSLESGNPDNDAGPPASMTTDEWWSLFQRLQRQLGTFDSVVEGSLGDDIADIYRDLRDGFVAYDSGDLGEAAWSWRTEFDSHWGRHAAHAIFALQVLRSECLS